MVCSKLAIFSVLLLIAVASARKSSESGSSESDSRESRNPFSSEPRFIERLSKKARKEYKKIINNETLTPVQIDSQLQQWAQKYNVVNDLQKYQDEQKQFFENLKINIEMVDKNLPNVFQQLVQLLEINTQTVRMQKQAIETLARQFPDEVATLFYIASLVSRRPFRPQNVTGSSSSPSPLGSSTIPPFPSTLRPVSLPSGVSSSQLPPVSVPTRQG